LFYYEEFSREVFNGFGIKMLVHCSYCSTFSSATTISKRWRRQRRKTRRVVANAASAREKSDDERTNRIIIIEEILNASTPERTLGIQEEEEDEAKRRVRARKAFSNRVKLIHPDVCEDERSAEATEKCVRAYAWLLNREEEFEREDTNKNTNNVYGSVFVNEILCVGASNCPSYSNCTVTAREYFRVNPKTKAARFERSEKSNPLNAATEAEIYAVHLAVEQCPRRCVHWLDEKQTQACEEELQKAIDGIELIDDTALRLEYMISAFTAENRLIERELRAAENRRERNGAASGTDNASWWK
jgi:ferredoxin